MTRIINSLLDTDLYKLTMQQAVMHNFMSANVEYHFRCRTDNVDLVQHIPQIKEEIEHMCSLRYTEDELSYLNTLRFLKSDYVDFLRNFQLQSKYVEVIPSDLKKGSIEINIKGPWVQTIPFEVPILAIINEVYYQHLDRTELYKTGRERLANKIEIIKSHPLTEHYHLSDFGTRRRFSYEWQREVVEILQKELPLQLKGTSNVLLAKELNLIPIGTMAHEYLQACQVLGPSLYQFQRFALETWAQEFRGDLGIALTDVVGTDAFLKEFDLYFCKLFDGVRHDSGNPYDWGDRFIEHYKKNRIDPISKSFVFSDGLDIPKSLSLLEHFHNRCKPAFGIGTNLTNDVGVTPLQVVIKMVSCNDQPVAKLSDTSGKTMSNDETYVHYLNHIFKNNK